MPRGFLFLSENPLFVFKITPSYCIILNTFARFIVENMKKRDFTSPRMWILTTGTESVLNASGGYDYDNNGIETGGGETGAGDDFWD